MDTLPTCFSKIKIDQPRLTVAADSIHFQVLLESINVKNSGYTDAGTQIEIRVLWAKITYIKSHSKTFGFSPQIDMK